jgi:YD repeat-containing protein
MKGIPIRSSKGSQRFLPSIWLLALIAIVLTIPSTPIRAATGGVSYTYDALGRVTTASYDTGVIAIYTYDANGNRTAQIVNVNSTTAVWNTFNWDAALWG